MNRQLDHETTSNKKIVPGAWLLMHKASLKWAGLIALLLLLAWASPLLLSAYNATGYCLNSFSKLSEPEMKRRVVKSIVAHYLEGARQEEKPGRLQIMFLRRSITQQELIQRNESGTLLDLLKEQPLLLSDEDQLDQSFSKIDAGEFAILTYSPRTTYVLAVLPGKSLYRTDSTIATEFFKKNKHLGLTDEKTTNFGNYLYQYEYYSLDTTCCNGKPFVDQEEVIYAKKSNLEVINFRKRFPEHRWSFPVSSCGSVWFPSPYNENRINFFFE